MTSWLTGLGFLSIGLTMSLVSAANDDVDPISLPTPESDGEVSVEEAIQNRRSIREFARGAIKLTDIAQLLWAAQGVTHRRGYRTAPSAGALYPLELYVVAGDVEGLSAGIYRYRPKSHQLIPIQSGDLRRPLASAALGQSWVRRAPAVLVFTAVYRRTAAKYGERARRYVPIEVGHAAQNVYLQATASGLATVLVGAFEDDEVQEALGLPAEHQPLGLMPVGRER